MQSEFPGVGFKVVGDKSEFEIRIFKRSVDDASSHGHGFGFGGWQHAEAEGSKNRRMRFVYAASMAHNLQFFEKGNKRG